MLVTPEYEDILLSSSPQAATLVPPEIQERNELGFGQIFNRSERQRAYSLGLQQALGSWARLDLSWWRRKVDWPADQAQFFDTGIVFPLNFTAGDLRGCNLRLDTTARHGVRAYLSLGHIHALYQPPFAGGLFLDGEALETLDAGPFLIDHDQDLQGQLGVYWDITDTPFWLGVQNRYDSGLVTEVEDSAEDLLADPDTAYAVPFLRLDQDPQRVDSRSVWSVSLGARLERYGIPLEVQVDLLNAFDEEGLYNFQSIFGGTHVIPPRTWAARIRYVF